MSEEKEISIENILIMEAAKIISFIIVKEAKKINQDNNIFPAIITELLCNLISSHIWSLGVDSTIQAKILIDEVSQRAHKIFEEFIDSLKKETKH